MKQELARDAECAYLRIQFESIANLHICTRIAIVVRLLLGHGSSRRKDSDISVAVRAIDADAIVIVLTPQTSSVANDMTQRYH